MQTVAEHFDLSPARGYTPRSRKFKFDETMSKRLVGIEVEVERVNDDESAPTGWNVKGDGSLRNNGVEFITPPIESGWVPGMFQRLLEFLDENAAFTMRTSIHVHVNAQDLTLTQAYETLCWYALVEPLLYRFVGRSRENSVFCVPLYKNSSATQLYLSSGRFQRHVEWRKYNGFNLACLSSMGTLEFRQMSGTNSTPHLTNWVKLVTRLVDFTKNNTGPTPHEWLLGDVDYNYAWRTIQEILGELTSLVDHFVTDDTLATGLESMRRVFIGSPTLIPTSSAIEFVKKYSL